MTSFGALLRRLRIAANLSQEALAEAARMSSAAIGAYERGIRAAPHRESLTLLADALGLQGTARSEFEAAGRRKSKPRVPPSVDADDPVSGNLPIETSSFVGRDVELTQLVQHLRLERFVTVTGSGGIGKTRLAVRAATLAASSYRDGVWFIDFSAVPDDGDVVAKTASVLSVVSPRSAGELALQLKTRASLLMFDNCERLVGPIAGLVEAITSTCPDITVLATSRQRFRLRSEFVFRLSALPVPGAVELFISRATSGEHTFDVTDDDRLTVARICRKLEGLPLAIELAAAQCATLGLRRIELEIAGQLSHLSTTLRDLPPRQRTLQATISWSLSLLDRREAAVLERMAVFLGGCTMEAVAAVCSDLDLDERAVADILTALVDKSLVNVQTRGAVPRYSMLDSTTHFLLGRLDEGQRNVLRRRHADWAAAFAVEHQYGMLEMATNWWHETIRPELDNVREAAEWSAGPNGEVLTAGRILGGLRNAWVMSHMDDEFQRLVGSVLPRVNAQSDPEIYAALLIARAGGLWIQYDLAVPVLREAIAICEQLGDERALVKCYLYLCHTCLIADDYEAGESATERAFHFAQKTGFRKLLPTILNFRAQALEGRKQYAEAKLTALDASRMAGRGSLDWFEIRFELAAIEHLMGDSATAADIVEDVFDVAVQQNFLQYAWRGTVEGATFALYAEQPERVERLALTSLDVVRGKNRQEPVVSMLHLAAARAVLGNDVRGAALLLGYVEHWFASSGEKPMIRTVPYVRDRVRAALEQRLPGDELARLLELGALLSHEQAETECFSADAALR